MLIVIIIQAKCMNTLTLDLISPEYLTGSFKYNIQFLDGLSFEKGILTRLSYIAICQWEYICLEQGARRTALVEYEDTLSASIDSCKLLVSGLFPYYKVCIYFIINIAHQQQSHAWWNNQYLCWHSWIIILVPQLYECLRHWILSVESANEANIPQILRLPGSWNLTC